MTACTTDLNPVKVISFILVRSVDTSRRRFSNFLELKKEIDQSSFDIKSEFLDSLINSIQARMFAVIAKNVSIIE